MDVDQHAKSKWRVGAYYIVKYKAGTMVVVQIHDERETMACRLALYFLGSMCSIELKAKSTVNQCDSCGKM